MIDFQAKSTALNKALYTANDLSGVSARIIHNWGQIGVLDDKRDDKALRRWNYYTAIDLVHIGLLQRLRAFGISSDVMIGCKKMLYTPIVAPDGKTYSNLEYAILMLLTYNHPAYLVVSFDEKDAKGFFLLDEKEYFAMQKKMELESYCTILLNSVIQHKLPPLYRKPDFDEYVGLQEEEIAILDCIKNKSFISILIVLRDGKVKTIEGTERVIDPKEIATLMQTDGYDTISLKRRKGQILAAHRTVRKNFKK